MAPVDPLTVEVKANGLVFVPWVVTARIFDEVFRPGNWGLMPLAKPMVQDNAVFAHMQMAVGGKYVGDAIGEQPFQLGPHRLSYATAYEGAVSDSISRLSKRLGMWRELWDRRWTKRWLDEYAVQVECRGRRPGNYWRRKDDPPLPDEVLHREQAESEYDRPMRFDDEANAHMDSMREPQNHGGSHD